MLCSGSFCVGRCCEAAWSPEQKSTAGCSCLQRSVLLMEAFPRATACDVPDRRKIPEADITMRTRKGVAVSYAPAQIAV